MKYEIEIARGLPRSNGAETWNVLLIEGGIVVKILPFGSRASAEQWVTA